MYVAKASFRLFYSFLLYFVISGHGVAHTMFHRVFSRRILLYTATQREPVEMSAVCFIFYLAWTRTDNAIASILCLHKRFVHIVSPTLDEKWWLKKSRQSASINDAFWRDLRLCSCTHESCYRLNFGRDTPVVCYPIWTLVCLFLCVCTLIRHTQRPHEMLLKNICEFGCVNGGFSACAANTSIHSIYFVNKQHLYWPLCTHIFVW